ncbi:MAG: RNA methyltransferase [Clostridia bacterium]|nr:RNA methyltransferase [Clostridia bacterium]
MQQITSLQNPRVRALRGLQDKKRRQIEGRFLVEGGKLVGEALAHTVVHTVVVEEEKAGHFVALLEALFAAGAQVLVSPRRVLEALCETKTPQGIVAEVDMPEPQASAGYLVAMDGVQDPGNVGAIIRTADAAGFDGVLLGPTCADPFGAKALRGSMGSIFRVPVIQTEELAEKLAALRREGYAVLSTQLDGEDFFERGPLPTKLVLVIGSEAEGVSAQIRTLATHRLRLPMGGGAESLNAAVAAGIMMYDLSRERE